MSVRMAVTYQGDLHCEGLHEPSGSRVGDRHPPADRGSHV